MLITVYKNGEKVQLVSLKEFLALDCIDGSL